MMHTSQVLGHLAQRFSVSEENIATEALTWILRRSTTARHQLESIVRIVGADVPDDLSYVGQVSSAEMGRPDVVGTDDSGQERLLIEAKFAAHLTEQQPSGYLARLPVGQPCAVLVIAPTVRLRSLWVELLQAVPGLTEHAPSPSFTPDDALRGIAATPDHVLALTSWRELATRLVEALQATGEIGLAHDAEQLLALTEVMDSQAYAPVRPGDYGPRAARQVKQLQVLIDDAHKQVIAGTLLEKNGNSSHGRIFYGWYLRTHAAQKSIWHGFLPRAWDRHGHSPLWVQITAAPAWPHQRLATALGSLDRTGGPGLFDDGEGFLVPLLIPHYASEQQSVQSIVDQLEQIATLLDAAVPPGESVVADEPNVVPDEDDPSVLQLGPAPGATP